MRKKIQILRKHLIPKILLLIILFCLATIANASYEAHGKNIDMESFLSVYPDASGTRLDDCFLCHPGGDIESPKGVVAVGSCDYCHKVYGYDRTGVLPLNVYGLDYQKSASEYGRTSEAIKSIGKLDSDSDKFTNEEEIIGLTFPGDANDHPGLNKPPVVKLSREDILSLPSYEQFMLMNSRKSNDYYAEYQGVPFDALLYKVGARNAESLTFFSIDGFSVTVPLNDTGDGYYLVGAYPSNTFHANLEWVTYPSDAGVKDGETIYSRPIALLAYIRDGNLLEPGSMSGSGEERLNGEGPYRLIFPQCVASPPDQPSGKIYVNRPFPYDKNADHNAGSCVKSIVAIRVNPLPAGTVDFDWCEGGWSLIEKSELIIYGAIKCE